MEKLKCNPSVTYHLNWLVVVTQAAINKNSSLKASNIHDYVLKNVVEEYFEGCESLNEKEYNEVVDTIIKNLSITIRENLEIWK